MGGGRRTKCQRVEAGEGLVKRRRAGEPGPGAGTEGPWKAEPRPSLKSATGHPQNASREELPSTGVPEPSLTRFSSLQAWAPLGSHLTHVPSDSPC